MARRYWISRPPAQARRGAIVGDTTSGADARQVNVVVKPFAPGLKTNLVVTTDRRTYHVAIESTDRTSVAAISWTIPKIGLSH
jgi:type IV secretory pathway VirB9-like protein